MTIRKSDSNRFSVRATRIGSAASAAAMVLAAFAFWSGQAAARAPARSEAATLARKAAVLQDRGEAAAAASLFRSAYDLSGDAKYLSLQGAACEAAGDAECAAAAYEKVARQDVDIECREAARRALERVQSCMRVSVACDVLPRGAKVFVDGKSAGTSPGRALQLRPGKHLIWAKLEGYLDASQVVEVTPGGPAPSVTLRLEARPALLMVVANVSSGRILIDGTEVEHLPLEQPLIVSAGEHLVEVVSGDTVLWKKRIQFTAGQESRLRLVMHEDAAATPVRPTPPGGASQESPPVAMVEKKQDQQVYPERYVPLAWGYMPFTGVRATHRVEMDMGYQTKSSNGLTVDDRTLDLGAEVAPLPGLLSLSAHTQFETISYQYIGMGVVASDSRSAVRTVDFGLKVTPLDDGRGNALAVGAKTSFQNARSEGWHNDLVGVAIGLLGSTAAGPFRLQAAAGGGDGIPLTDGVSPTNYFQWALQPSIAFYGPHNLGLSFVGAIPVVDGEYEHLVDGAGGYLYAGESVKAALTFGVPLTHAEERADLGMFMKFGWEY